MRPSCIAVVLCLWIATPVAAGQARKCQETESALQCADRLEGLLRGISPPAVKKDPVKVADVGPKTETGLADLPNGLSSSTKDFLPLLQFGALLGPVVTDEKTGLVVVALNPRQGESFRNLQVRALINSKPTLFQPLKSALDDATVKGLEDEIAKGKNRQDVALEMSFNLTGYRSGRNLAAYAPLVNAFFERAVIGLTSAENATTSATMSAMDAILKGTTFTKDKTELGVIPDPMRTQLEGLAQQLAAAVALGEKKTDEAMTAAGLLLFAQMVNNQPQMIFTISHAWRDPLVGPNGALTGRFAVERAFGGDLKSFLDTQGGYDRCLNPRNVDQCFLEFKEYVATPGRQEKIKTGLRFAAYVEFTNRRNEYAPVRADGTPLPFVLKQGTIVTGGVDFGRLLEVDEDGQAGGRVDASIRWDYHGTTDTQNRLLASITITRKFGGVAVPIGLVYANRSAFLSKDSYDHGLSANVGLKFNLFKGLK